MPTTWPTTRTLRTLVCLALPLAAAGCTTSREFPWFTYNLDTLQATQFSGSQFTQTLAAGYRDFALDQKNDYDWQTSAVFAKKGLAAAHGAVVPPEQIADWPVSDPAANADVTAGRQALVAMLASGAPNTFPTPAATAQVKFDCWLEEQHEGWETDEIAECRKAFQAAMAQVGGTKTVATTTPPAVVAPAARNYLVFFDFDRSEVKPEADGVLSQAVSQFKSQHNVLMHVTGYTDTVGSVSYNQALSERRAKAVEAAIEKLGVSAKDITVEGKGKGDLLVSTGDGVREPQNRRAQIVIAP